MVGPGGAFSSTESHRPAMPCAAASATDASRQIPSRCVHKRTVAAGTTKSAVASSAPIAVRDATTANATSTSSSASGSGERRPMARAAPGSNPCASQRGPRTTVATMAAALAAPASTRSRVSVSRRLPKSSESTLPAEWNTSLASTTPPARAATSTSAVRLSYPARGLRARRSTPNANSSAAANAPSGAENPETVRKHQPGKRRRPDCMRIEREPTHDDPGTEQARSPREQQNLEQTALNERKLKRLEHEPNLIDTHSHYKKHTGSGPSRPGLTPRGRAWPGCPSMAQHQ